MELNKHLLNKLVLGLGLALASCDPGPAASEKPGMQRADTIKQGPELSNEDTATVPILPDPNNCPACGMG